MNCCSVHKRARSSEQIQKVQSSFSHLNEIITLLTKVYQIIGTLGETTRDFFGHATDNRVVAQTRKPGACHCAEDLIRNSAMYTELP